MPQNELDSDIDWLGRCYKPGTKVLFTHTYRTRLGRVVRIFPGSVTIRDRNPIVKRLCCVRGVNLSNITVVPEDFGGLDESDDVNLVATIEASKSVQDWAKQAVGSICKAEIVFRNDKDTEVLRQEFVGLSPGKKLHFNVPSEEDLNFV